MDKLDTSVEAVPDTTDLCMPARPERRVWTERVANASDTSPRDPGTGYLLDWETDSDRTLPDSDQPDWGAEPAPGLLKRPNDQPMIRVARAAHKEPTRNGGYSIRFDLMPTDPEASGSKRAELSFWPAEARNTERWYGFSTYLHNWLPDRAPESIFQWHQGAEVPCTFGCSPPLGMINRENASTGQYEQYIHQAWRPTAGDEHYVEYESVA